MKMSGDHDGDYDDVHGDEDDVKSFLSLDKL